VRSLALVINQADGQQWRMAMNTPPVLPVGTPEAFHNKQIRALAPDPATGKPNPQTLAAFFDAHPESAAFRAWRASYRPSDSWANTQYHSINAFVLVGADGQRQPVRWAMVAEQAFAPLGEGPHAADALSQEFTQCLRAGPVRWTVRLQLAGPGDPTDNAASACLESWRQIDAGRVELSGAEPQQGGACSGLNSDPLVLPRGIEASADPIQSNPIQSNPARTPRGLCRKPAPPPPRNPAGRRAMSSRYPLSARLLHWALAALLLSMVCLGAAMVDRWQPCASTALQLHKVSGLLALSLVLLRLLNRLRFRAPALPADLPLAQRAIAQASHFGLYVLMLKESQSLKSERSGKQARGPGLVIRKQSSLLESLDKPSRAQALSQAFCWSHSCGSDGALQRTRLHFDETQGGLVNRVCQRVK